MTATTAILAQINKCIRAFRKAQATSPATAIIPSEHGIRQSFVFEKLVRKGVIVSTGNGRYYLNEDKEISYRKRRQSIALVVLLLIVIGVIISIATSNSV